MDTSSPTSPASPSLSARIRSKLARARKRLVRAYFKKKVSSHLLCIPHPCILCGNNSDFSVLYTHDRYNLPIRTVACARCGFIFSNPAPAPSFMARFYEKGWYRGMYLGYLHPNERDNDGTYKKAEQNTLFVNTKLSLPANASVLDVGSAYGGFLITLKKTHSEYRIYGVEPGASFRKVHSGALDGVYDTIEYLPDHMRFHLITLWHVLEHTTNPIETLRQLKNHLHPEGVIALEVPDYHKYQGIRNIHIAHLYHFTPDTMRRVAHEAGFDVIEITDEFCDPRSSALKALLSPRSSKRDGL